MSPVSLVHLPRALGSAAERGMRRAIERTMFEYIIRPGVPQKAGLATGALIMAYGYRAIYRYERWKRIEHKLDRLLEEAS